MSQPVRSHCFRVLLISLFLLCGPPRAGAETAKDPPAKDSPAKDPPAKESVPTPFPEHIEGKNVTADFTARYAQKDESKLIPKTQLALLHRYEVLLVPGFLTALYIQIEGYVEKTFDKEGVMNYLQEEQQTLKELGVSNPQTFLNRAEFNTQLSVAAGAKRIVKAVHEAAAHGKRLILISDSKGGNDTLAALLLLQKERKLQSVGGWISIQGVFLGTPLADEVMSSDVLKKSTQLFLEKEGGTIESVTDQTTDACKKFMTAHQGEIKQLVKSLPIISFASWKTKPADFQLLHPDTVLFKTRDFMADKGMLNDGLVPTHNAILAGTSYIATSGIDHSETVMTNQPPVGPSKLEKPKFTRVLLGMLLTQMEQKQKPRRP